MHNSNCGCSACLGFNPHRFAHVNKPIDWQARAEQAEQKCAELAAALDRENRLAVEMLGYVKSYGLSDYGPSSEYSRWSQCRCNILNSIDPSAILAAYRAQVERETLETIGSLLGLKLCSCWEEIQQRFAPKGEPDAKRD